MDYMVNGMLVEILQEEEKRDQVLKEYMERFQKVKEGGDNAE